MLRTPIKLNQVWKQKGTGFTIVVSGKSRHSHKWKTKVLTDKSDVFAGSHTMSQWTIWKRFELQ